MSLVEQAAKRLEQLRNAGRTAADDPSSSGGASTEGNASERNVSTIERIVHHMDGGPSSGATASGPVRLPPQPAANAAPSRDDLYKTSSGNEDLAARERDNQLGASLRSDGIKARQDLRREPIIGEPLELHDGETRDEGTRSRKIAVDLKRLAAAGILTPDAIDSRLANELRIIKRPIVNNCLGKSASRDTRANRVMITSSSPGEGKSFLSANLAMSIAMERDSTVLLIEADTARPSLSNLFGLPSTPGLLDLLVNPNHDVANALIRTDVPKLAFLPAGTLQQNSNELLASEAMERLVGELASRYPDRILIFDSPPLMFSPEARVLAHYMGQVVVVVEAEKTTHSMLNQALSMVEDCPVVLLALNKATSPEEKAYYYYTG